MDPAKLQQQTPVFQETPSYNMDTLLLSHCLRPLHALLGAFLMPRQKNMMETLNDVELLCNMGHHPNLFQDSDQVYFVLSLIIRKAHIPLWNKKSPIPNLSVFFQAAFRV